MSSLNIIYFPNKRLRDIADPVDNVDNNIKNIAKNMLDTMYEKNGIGLAATQVGIKKQIIVINLFKDKNKSLILINPKLINKNGYIRTKEGCLSIPNQRGYVIRYKKIKIKALNFQSCWFELEAEGLLSVCIQHEMDHLIGKLFIDYFSPIKRMRIKEKFSYL